MLVPLSMTLYFSFIRYVLNSLRPEWTTPASVTGAVWELRICSERQGLSGCDPELVFIVSSILVLTVILAWYRGLDQPIFPGRGIVRVLLISPFFVMPAVNAVLWINMILDPVLGPARFALLAVSMTLIDGLRDFPVLGFLLALA